MTSYLAEKYDYWMNDLSDPRVKNWTSVSSPFFTLTIIFFYLFSVLLLLPAYMRNRKPYSLKTFLYCYNIFQIVSCLVLIYGVATSGWTTTYSWRCQPVDYSDNPEAVSMLRWVFYTYVLKGIELIETFVFILRKKFNQVSKLHVYHHSSTFFLTWVGVKYVGGGMATFPILINSFIHVLMYSYYFLASLGPHWQKRVSRWKSRLTMFQMIQFCVLIAHSLQSLDPGCDVPRQLLLLYVPNVLLIFHMFWEFYKKNYLSRRRSSKSS